MIRKDDRKQYLVLFAALVFIMTLLMPLKAYAADSIVIRKLNLTFKSQYGDEEILMPEISTTTSGVTIQDILWKRDISKWKAASNERVSVILTSDSMVFAESYNRSECKITGAKFVSAKPLDNHTLEVKVDYVPVVKLGRTSQAGWSDSKKTKAVWKKVEFATGYQVALYADDKMKKRISVSTNVADLSEYMDKDANYYYEVRAIGYTAEDRKYMKEGDYVTSEDVFMEYDGDTTGTWKGNTYKQEDGGVPKNSWKQILNDWYYFDGNGIRQTGWLQSGQRWYYLSPSDGKLLTGWQFVNGKWYYLNPQGGEMMTGWVQTQPGVWYYLYSDGSMASNTNVGDYWVDASGKWVS
ncbi:N-acetylmuramoyl-L-alanine amidase family protein [Lacrimispora sp. JR3]|uniref:N-acetylmuramoyl-L-alanine amidase family protein n=1 Tax=Lacrimispora sinapis TaxID=3111456 RepID=UPI0037490842